jgi:bifunctional DNase/RNase
VIIHKLVDGVFYSIICEDKIEEIIDARTSDAIALALRFNAPIYTYKNILDKAGIYLKANSTETDKDSQEIDDILSNPETFGNKEESNQSGRLYINSLQELSELLDQAVLQEDYEKAAKIRDEISKENLNLDV